VIVIEKNIHSYCESQKMIDVYLFYWRKKELQFYEIWISCSWRNIRLVRKTY